MFDELENLKDEFVFSKDRIICTLLNRKRNEKLLQSIPYTPLHDMAVIYRYLIGESEEGLTTVIITNRMLKTQGPDKESLFSLAVKNTARRYPSKIELMSDTLFRLFSSECSSQEDEIFSLLTSQKKEDTAFPIYVLTNKSGILGATVIIYPDLLEQLAEKLQSSLIVIPSSIHEALVVKASMPLEEATRMLREVNASCVEEREVLSDKAMYFAWSKEKERRLYENTRL